jgi:hypothetical protein
MPTGPCTDIVSAEWDGRSIEDFLMNKPAATLFLRVMNESTNKLRVMCADRVLNVNHSGNLSVQDLQAKVARFMRCELSRLVYLGMEPEHVVSSSAAGLSYPSLIHFKITADVNDVDMEDV